MKILSTNIYIGPNLYAKFPVIKHIIDIGILEEYPSVKLGNDFINNLINAIPTLSEHGCSYRSEGGFVRRLKEDEGTWIGHIWEHITLEIQSLAGSNVSFGRTRMTNERPAQYNMIFEYHQRDVGLESVKLARELLISLMPKKIQDKIDYKVEDDFNFEKALVRFIRFAQSKQLGPSTGSLVEAAVKKNIPYLRLNNYSLVQFGQGKYQQRIQATITGQTSQIAVSISCDKEETNNILNALGLPVPQQKLVRSKSDVLWAAKRLGYPVVMKPLDGNHGRGITIDINDDDKALEGFEIAKDHSSTVVIENFIEGFDHRMLVVDGKLVAVGKRVPGHVLGDGEHTIEQLVDIVNEDPRRGVGHEKVLTQLSVDYHAKKLIEEAGYTPKTILKKDEVLYIRNTANLSTGGTAIDVTDLVHPDNKEMAERSVKAVGLDVGGVDFLTQDIARSYKEIGGGICEVNAAPGFRMHVVPTEGKSRDVSGAVIDMLFPNETKSRIPIASITGTNGKTTTSRMLAHILKNNGKVVGLTTTDGIYINDKLTVSGDTTGPKSAQMVLRDPSVEVAVMETARGGLLRSGLGYDYCNVGACLNITSDHLGLKGINTLEQLAKVKQIVTDAAKDVAILNADDKYCLQMASFTEAKQIMYITMNRDHRLVKEHIRAGGMAVIIEQGINGEMITIFDNNIHIPVLWTHLIPATLEGRAVHNVQNAMFAIALSYSMKVSLDSIRSGLRTFNTSFFQAPGRMNIFEEHDFKVIMDYGHNVAAIDMVGKTVSKFEVKGKRTAVVACPGDRRNQDIMEVAETLAPYFDTFICREDDNLRGRKTSEVASMLKQELMKNGISEENITIITSEQLSVQHALETANENDLVVIFVDNISRTWKQIIYFNKNENKTKNNVVVENILENNNAVESEEFHYKDGSWVKDARGVRLAKSFDEDSD